MPSGGLEDRGHTLAAADAHGLEQVPATSPAQLAQAGGEHSFSTAGTGPMPMMAGSPPAAAQPAR